MCFSISELFWKLEGTMEPGHLSRFQHKYFVLILMLLYPAITVLQHSFVFGVPFDSETTARFLMPFVFSGKNTVEWTLTESIQHGFTRPIYSMSFLTDYTLYGNDYRFYHLTDFILSWTTFGLLLYLLRKRFGLIVAALSLTLWALHPAQTFSFVSFTGRNDRLIGIFVLVTIMLCDKAFSSSKARNRFLILALITAAVGSFAKETSLPYLALSFGWCWIAMGRDFLSVCKDGRFLWLGGGGLFIILMLTKPLISSNLVVPAEIGTGYLVKMACLFNWGIPGSVPANLVTGSVGIALLVLTAISGRLPKTVRMGAFITIVSLAPFPFVWVQKTFLWLPSVGLCLIAAGLFEYLFALLREFRVKNILKIATALCIFSATAVWGYSQGKIAVETPIAIKLAVRQLSETQGGPVYDSEPILESIPGLVPFFAYNEFEPEVTQKNRRYLQQLLQLHTLNSEAIIVWQ